ncbi:MAG TPA: T9SS type A sorting domain-containing protein, partial [Ignavibacteriaceae bacterium]
LANIIPTKIGQLHTIQSQPFTDSLFVSTEGTTGYEYFNISRIEEFLIQIDSLGLDTTFSFVDFFTSLQDWYSIYRFDAVVGNDYTLVSVDTTVITYDLTFEYVGTRLQDETIQTVLGTFLCKKFLVQWKILYHLLPPPFPAIELLTTNDTIWIAPENWIVKDVIPANNIDLSFLGFPPFTIPGLWIEVTDTVTSVEDEFFSPGTIYLSQNYPNPFNPTTNFEFRIVESGFVNLKVYDILGNEVATLVDEFKPTGRYDVEFDASGLSSGIYFYKLRAGDFTETKKMILMK